jgi:hypothetical protein
LYKRAPCGASRTIFSGGGGFIADPQLRTLAGVWAMLAQSFFAPRPAVWCVIAIAAVFLMMAAPRRPNPSRETDPDYPVFPHR